MASSEEQQQANPDVSQAIEPAKAKGTLAWMEETELNGSGVELRSLDDLFRFSRMVIAADMAPRGITRPEQVALVVQAGLEVGISPMLALRWSMVVNNRPCWWGDLPLALARRSPLWDEAAFDEHFEGEKGPDGRLPDDYAAVCTVHRKGGEKKSFRFDVLQAKAANLWTKKGPWQEYPDRMLMFRARSFLLRDQFGDALGGMAIAEEYIGAPPDVVADAEHEMVPKGLDDLAAKLEDQKGWKAAMDRAAEAADPPEVVEKERVAWGRQQGLIKDEKPATPVTDAVLAGDYEKAKAAARTADGDPFDPETGEVLEDKAPMREPGDDEFEDDLLG